MVKKISTTVILVAALLAITVVALAAGSLIFGWVDFYKDGYNVDVPDDMLPSWKTEKEKNCRHEGSIII